MNEATYLLVALLMAAIPAGALITGKALGVWWYRSLILRGSEPAAYWFVVAIQLGIFILFVLTGKSWYVR